MSYIKLTILLIASIVLIADAEEKNNVCDNYEDYLDIDTSPNCRFDYAVNRDMPELLKAYEIMEYEVVTEDKYILKMFRMKHSAPKGVVYLQHPSVTSCTVWVDKETSSLGRQLFAEGYEVWLGNFRGNFYSRKHETFDPDVNKSYWEFSFHEMGIYDIPAQIDKIIEITGFPKVTFIAQSMGGSAATIYAALKPDDAFQKVDSFILLAPAVFLKDVRTPVKALAPIANELYAVTQALGLVEFLPRNDVTKELLLHLCTKDPVLMKICMMFLQMYVGPDKEYADASHVPLIFTQSPAGISVKCFVHFGKMINAGGKFVYFDDETKEYPLADIKNDFYLMAGDADYLVSVSGVDEFAKKLRENGLNPDVQTLKHVSHLHFLYGSKLTDIINKPIIDYINKRHRESKENKIIF